MSGVRDFLARLVVVLDDSKIPYMLTGSFASTFHGTPRATQDLDLVIDADEERLAVLLGSLEPSEYYFSDEAARQALRRRGQFNIIDMASGWKADLILRKDREFSREEFRRRMSGRILETTVAIATAEDTVIAKLEWAARGHSERQLRDVAGILETVKDLDTQYIENWVKRLGLGDWWDRARESTPPCPSS